MSKTLGWFVNVLALCVWGALAFEVGCCVTGCAPEVSSQGEGGKRSGRGVDEPADESDAGAPDAAPAVEDASRPVEDAGQGAADASQRPDAAASDAGAPDASSDAGATLDGAWEVSAELEGDGCGLGELDVLEWRVRPGTIEQPPPDNALVWQEGAYQAASGGWVVRVELRLEAGVLRGVLERRAPPQCALERYQLHGVRP